MPSKNARARRDTLAIIASGKRHLKYLGDLWTVRGTVYVPNPDDSLKRGDYRDRRSEEYPENQAATWAATAVQVDKLIYELTVLRDYATRNAGPDHAASIARHRARLLDEDI